MLTLASVWLRWRVRYALLLATRGASSALRRRLCGRWAGRRLEIKVRGGAGQGERGAAKLGFREGHIDRQTLHKMFRTQTRETLRCYTAYSCNSSTCMEGHSLGPNPPAPLFMLDCAS